MSLLRQVLNDLSTEKNVHHELDGRTLGCINVLGFLALGNKSLREEMGMLVLPLLIAMIIRCGESILAKERDSVYTTVLAVCSGNLHNYSQLKR